MSSTNKMGLFSGLGRNASRTANRLRKMRRVSALESLEQRTVMSTLALASGVLTYTDSPGSTTLTLSNVGDTLTFNDSNHTFSAYPSGWSLDSTGHIASGPASSVTSMALDLANGGDTADINTTLKVPISVLNGGVGADTLIGPDVPDTWTLTGPDGAGTMNWSGGSTPNVTFSNIQSLRGGLSNDTFVYQAGSFNQIDGGAGGSDTLDLSSLTGAVSIDVTGAGYHHGYTGTGSGSIPDFDNIDSVVGSTNTSNTLNDTIGGSDWVISGANAGTLSEVAPGALPLAFSAFQNLVGGGGDVFSFRNAGSIAGDLDGGPGDSKLDYSAYNKGDGTGVTVNLNTGAATGVGGSIHHIDEVAGSRYNDSLTADGLVTAATFDVSPGQDTIAGETLTGTTIQGPDGGSTTPITWAITGHDTGTVSYADGTTSFSAPLLASLSLRGGSGTNVFQFKGDGSILGDLMGGSGKNVLDYSGYNHSAVVNLPADHASGVLGILGFGGHVANITEVIGSPGNDTIRGDGSTIVLASAGDDGVSNVGTLQGTDAGNTWNITDPGAGQLLFGANVTTFTNANGLTGGAGNDRFNFYGYYDIAGKIDGGLGTTNTIDLSPISGAYGDVNLAGPGTHLGFAGNVAGFISGTASFDDINQVVGSSYPTLAENSIDASGYSDTLSPKVTPSFAWDVTGPNAGTVTETARGRSLAFSQTQEMYGSPYDDAFQFEAGARIDGGLYDAATPQNTRGNTLDYSAYTTPVAVNLQLTTQTATGTGNISGDFTTVIGGHASNSLTAENLPSGAPPWFPRGTKLVAGGSIGGSTNTLTGGNGNDTFVWSAGDGPTTIVGGGTAAISPSISPKHGEDQVVLNGSAAGGDNLGLVQASGALYVSDNGANVLTMSGITAMTVNTQGAANSLALDSGGGSPIPIPNSASHGLTFNGSGTDSMSLIGALPGGPYQYETYQMGGGGAGTINLDGYTIQFSGLSPITDTTPATSLNVVVGAGSQSFDVVNAPAIGSMQLGQIVSDGTAGSFESLTFANKAGVAINPYVSTDPSKPSTGEEDVQIDLPTLPTGLGSLTLNTGAQTDQVSVTALPPSLTAAINTNGGGDQVSVNLAGVPGSATLNVNGGTGPNQLDISAAGGTSTGTISESMVSAGYADGTHAVNYVNFANVPVTSYPNAAPNPGPTLTLNAVQGSQLTNAIVATFKDATPAAKASDFTATINWGDGPGNPTAGVVVQDAQDPTTFYVEGSHTYTGTGKFALQVTVQAQGHFHSSTVGATTVTVDSAISPSAMVSGSAIVPIGVSGQLSPGSDVGYSNGDGITNVNTPTFTGSSAPGATITLTATPTGGGTPIVIGKAVAAANGFWSITSSALPDGSYTIAANAVDASGSTTAAAQIMPSGVVGQLVIDTAPIVVTGARLDPAAGTITLTLSDPQMDILAASVGNVANYKLSVPGLPGIKFSVTGVTIASDGTTTTITIQFNKSFKKNTYNFTALSKSLIHALGIQDKAGNGLAGGDYFATFKVKGRNPVEPMVLEVSRSGHLHQVARSVRLHAAARPHAAVRVGVHHPAGAARMLARQAGPIGILKFHA